MNDILEVLKVAKNKNGMLGNHKTILDEQGCVTFGYVDRNNQTVEVLIPLDGVKIVSTTETRLNIPKIL